MLDATAPEGRDGEAVDGRTLRKDLRHLRRGLLGRPRIKDPKGRYFCKPCYERARERQALQRAALAPADAPREDGPDLEELLPDEPAAPATPCPGCGSPLAAAAVICTSCGFNVSTGRAIAPPAVTAAPAKSSATIWPVVVGVLSIVMGAGGSLLNGLGLVAALLGDGGVSGAVVSVLPLLLSVWLLLAGIGVVRRTASGVQSLRRWAIIKTVLVTLCGGVAVLAVFAMSEVPARFAQELGPDAAYWGPGFYALVLLAAMAWALLWPVFVLIWLSRASVQNDVERWT